MSNEGQVVTSAVRTEMSAKIEALRWSHPLSCSIVRDSRSRHCDCGAQAYNDALDDVLEVLALPEDGEDKLWFRPWWASVRWWAA